ncbi:hypothetical protein D3C76_1385780 [compost metagenome]
MIFNVFVKAAEPERNAVGNKMDLMSLFRQLFTQFGRYYPRAAKRRIAGNSYFQKWVHMVGGLLICSDPV